MSSRSGQDAQEGLLVKAEGEDQRIYFNQAVKMLSIEKVDPDFLSLTFSLASLSSLFNQFCGVMSLRVCASVKLCVCFSILVAAMRSYSRSTGALHTPDSFGAAGEG